MAEIHTGAQAVYIWLGFATSQTEIDVAQLEEVMAFGNTIAKEDYNLDDGESSQKYDRVCNTYLAACKDRSSLLDLAERPYWTRL
jgi:hypothetical protein